jgi:hypothetical protein
MVRSGLLEAYGTYRGPTATGTAKLELLAGRTYTVKGLAQSPFWQQYHQTAAYIVDETSDEVIAYADVRRFSELGCGSSNSIFFNIPLRCARGECLAKSSIRAHRNQTNRFAGSPSPLGTESPIGMKGPPCVPMSTKPSAAN